MKFKLTKNMRLKATYPDDEQRLIEFRDYLLNVGDGKETICS